MLPIRVRGHVLHAVTTHSARSSAIVGNKQKSIKHSSIPESNWTSVPNANIYLRCGEWDMEQNIHPPSRQEFRLAWGELWKISTGRVPSPSTLPPWTFKCTTVNSLSTDHLVAVVLLSEHPHAWLDHTATETEHEVESGLWYSKDKRRILQWTKSISIQWRHKFDTNEQNYVKIWPALSQNWLEGGQKTNITDGLN